MEKDINKLRKRLEQLYLKFGINNAEVIKLSQELDEVIFSIQQNQLKEYNRKYAS